MRNNQMPPYLFHRFFRWYCRPTLVNHIEGDLLEVYGDRLKKFGKRKADLLFAYDVVLLLRPCIFRPTQRGKNLNTYGMYKSYFKIGCRNLLKNKGYSFINISGLALGMTVAVLIGLWTWDELSFNKNSENYDRIAAVMQNATYGESISTWSSQSMQLGPELRNTYGNNFKYVVMCSIAQNPILTFGDKAIIKSGDFMEADGPEMLSLDMLAGSRAGLTNPNTILLSQSTVDALFGEKDPMGEILKIDNQFDVTVTGVYRDLPPNSSFSDLMFVAPLDLLVQGGNRNLGWVNNWLEVFVQLEDNRDMASVSMAIKDAKLKKVDPTIAKLKPELFLYPMSRWRLYSGFENGVNTGGRIVFVWLFGAIGVIVLLLACINFMNLSTARSEKRAKEVGIRKVVGSLRSQLIGQFLSESFLIVLIALIFSIILVQLALPWFNVIADKQMSIDWTNSWLWLSWLGTGFVTAVVAGSYPAFYLSGFRPGMVLKGTTHFGRRATLPRKALVVIQFTVSVTLIIGTAVVYEQIQFARNRPLGYNRSGLLFIPMKTAGVKSNFEMLKNDLIATGRVSVVSRSECAATNMYWSDGGLRWKGKDPDMQDIVFRGAVDFEFGKTVGWKIKEGRDFSRDYASDSSAMILNEAAVTYMGLENPVGEVVNRYGQDYTIIGVVEDMVSQSLYRPAAQTYYVIDAFNISQFINVKIKPESGINQALLEIEKVFRKNNPATPFEYRFADDQIADKFAYEARVGKLAGIFAALAIVISCLGLFGLAAFMAEQRTKEIGIRKVVGASVFSLWKLLSKDFLTLVAVACFIAIPIAYYIMDGWLQQYDYRTNVSMGLLIVTCLSAMAITLLTISYQSIKAATMNPVKSLRSE